MADETNLFDSLSGITVTSGFKAQIEKPLDQRDQVDTINDLHKLVDENGAWEGMKVYVKETKTTYELKGDTNDDWVATNEDIANDVVTPEKLDRKYIELKSVDSATDLDAVTSTGVYTVNTEVEDISSKHFPLSPDGNYWSDGTMIVTEQDNNESMQIFIHDGELDAGIAIRTVDATNQTNYKHDYTFLKPDGTNITGGYTAGRNAKVATYEGTALEFMFLGQYKNGKQLENTQGSPLGLYDKNLLTPSVNSGAQVLNIFDFGKEANIATVTLYVSDNGANTTNMVCLTNDISEGRTNYKDILRTSGAIQNGVPILENKLATDGYIKVGYLDGSYIGKYRYIIVYDWSNTCTASELQVETDIVETPIPAIQIGDGTNNNPYTFQVYDYTLLNEDGKIPSERLPDSSCESYMFEWSDGNTSNADRRGLFVTLDGEKIEPATSTSEYILGVVCGQPAVVGDAYSHNWQGMYERDVFGDYKRDSDGNLIISALYDHTLGGNNYASRESRKEWASVGIIGKLVVTDDGTCQVNGYCKPKAGGIATAVPAGELSTVTYDSTSEAISINNTHKYRVLSRIDSTHIKILFR